MLLLLLPSTCSPTLPSCLVSFLLLKISAHLNHHFCRLLSSVRVVLWHSELSAPTQTPSSQSSRNGGSAFSFSFFLLNCKELLIFTDCIENLLLGSPINTETHPFKKSDPRGILRLCLKQQSTPIQEQIHVFH